MTWFSIHFSLHQSLNPPTHPLTHPPTDLSIQLSIHPSMHLSIQPSIHPTMIHPSFHSSIHPHTHPPIPASIFPSIQPRHTPHPSILPPIHPPNHDSSILPPLQPATHPSQPSNHNPSIHPPTHPNHPTTIHPSIPNTQPPPKPRSQPSNHAQLVYQKQVNLSPSHCCHGPPDGTCFGYDTLGFSQFHLIHVVPVQRGLIGAIDPCTQKRSGWLCGMPLCSVVPVSIPITHLPSPGMCRTWRRAPAPRRAPPPGTWPLAPALAPGPPLCPLAPAAPPRPPPALPGAGNGSPRSLHGPAAHPGPPEPRQRPLASTGAWDGGSGEGAGDAMGPGCGVEGKRGWHGPLPALFGCPGGGIL